MDHRDYGRPSWLTEDRDRMVLRLFDDYDEEDERREIPAKFDVCPDCEGKGRYVNPSIDSHGISAEEWNNDWDDEEREMYVSGAYDVPCKTCKGKRVVLVPSELASKEDLEALYGAWDEENAHRAECEAEHRMGC